MCNQLHGKIVAWTQFNKTHLLLKLKKILTRNGAKVYCNDPYVINKDYQSIKYIKKKCDIIFIATPHLKYKKLKFDKKIVIDCWDFLSD